MPLSNEPCIIRLTFIDLNPFELNHYPFMISLGKCNGNCNVVNDLSTKIYVPSKTKYVCVPIEINDVDVRVVNMIMKLNETKTLVKHVSCDCK